MPSNRYPIIAKEGWLILLIVVLLGLFLLYRSMPSYSIPVWIILLGLIYLLRDPQRIIPSSPLAIVSPIEGVVESVSHHKDQWIGREAIRVRIRMNYCNTYTIRSPMEGKVVRNWSSEPVTLGSSDKIYRHAFWIQSDEGDDILTAIYIGKLTSRLQCYLHPGERVGQGQRCGYFILGGVVDVYFPTGSRISIKQGDPVLSGSSVLGQLSHKKTPSLAGIQFLDHRFRLKNIPE